MTDRIIINADDFGSSETTNEAISFAFEKGIINQTTLLVNRKTTHSAIELAKRKGFIEKVGLHLCLDAGYPLTEDIKREPLFCDPNGAFNRRFKSSVKARFLHMPLSTKEAVAKEVRAQIELFLSFGNVLLHVDSHHHIHNNLSLLKVILPIFLEYGFESMRLALITDYDGGFRLLYKKYVNKLIREFFPLSIPFLGPNVDYVSEHITEFINEQRPCLGGKN